MLRYGTFNVACHNDLFFFLTGFLFSFRPSCVSVHVSFMYHKHFFFLSVPILDLWNIPLQFLSLFRLFIFLFIFIQSCFV